MTTGPELPSTTATSASPATAARRYSGWQVALFTFGAVVLGVLLTLFIGYRMIFPKAFSPTELSQREQAALDAKLQRLEPERYSEAGAERELHFTEKELNALVASSPEMAQRLAIDLSDNLASAKLLVPLPPDFPLFGGQTLRVNAGLQLTYTNGRPVVVLQGVSLMGVPIPNAWLGGLKNVDLVQEFGGGQGFWKAFADGVESIEVQDGELQLVLKE
jgi:hypothetical protein